MSEIIVEHTQAKNDKRAIGLDFFRVSLALLVFAFHSRVHIGSSYWIFSGFVRMGALAMTGFFMLSGYVLGLSHKHQNYIEKKDILSFYLKRIIQIFPSYLFIAIVYILFFGNESVADNLLLLPIELFGMQSFFGNLSNISHNGVTWFISCLCFCYFMFPFVQKLTKMMSVKTRKILLVSLYAILIYLPFVLSHFSCNNLYDNPIYRFFEFYLGVLLSEINMAQRSDINIHYFSRWALLMCVTILLIIVTSFSVMHGNYDILNLNWIVVPSMIVYITVLGKTKFLHFNCSKSLLFLSNISYTFFLVQCIVWPVMINYVENSDRQNNLLLVVLSFMFCLSAATLVYYFIDKQIKRHFLPILNHNDS